jgi:hypothetical protein
MKLLRFVPRTNDFGYLDNSGDWSLFVKGKPINSWKPITVKYVAHGKKSGDFPGLLLNVPVFSKNAWEILQKLVEKDVQAFEITTKVGPYFVINVLAVIDCLDKKHSEFVYYPNGSIMRVASYVFKKGTIKNHHMFLIPETTGLEVLVTEEFVNVVQDNKLAGVRFEYVGEA